MSDIRTELAQEAKGMAGPGSISDHLDFAERWIEKIIPEDALTPPANEDRAAQAREISCEERLEYEQRILAAECETVRLRREYFAEDRGSFVPAIHVPGVYRCARCNFQLIQSWLNAKNGTITARDDAGEECPNDGSPLWRVTWKEYAADQAKIAEDYFDRATKAESALEALNDRGPVREASEHKMAFYSLWEPLSWMQGSKDLNAYLGWNLADIANDLIDRAYPGLRPKAATELERVAGKKKPSPISRLVETPSPSVGQEQG